jgi:peptidoglycan/xylan/chitin deacetylase (PgdA/CDA1 family)
MTPFSISASVAARCSDTGNRASRVMGAGLGLVVLAALNACAIHDELPSAHPAVSNRVQHAASPPAAAVVAPHRPKQVVAQSERYVIYVPGADDTLQSIARRFLGSETLDWLVADFNDTARAHAGQPLVVPLQHANLTGVFTDGYQTVPVLCYHRFGSAADKMTMTPANFAAQLEYLARNDYRVIRLVDLVEFMEGKRPLPKRAVVITIDDGYASAYHTAFPLLKRYGFPATLFIYTDFIGAKDALTWAQMEELVASGLIDVQPHSKTHTNLAFRRPSESEERYRERLDAEVRIPRQIVQQRLPVRVTQFAYPYGQTNDIVVQRLSKAEYKAAVTVNAGPNAFFASPFALRRTMIFGDYDLETFKAKLQVFKEVKLQ